MLIDNALMWDKFKQQNAQRKRQRKTNQKKNKIKE